MAPPRSAGSRSDAGLIVAGVAALFALLVGGMVSSSHSWHLVLVIGLAPLALAVAWFSPRKCLFALVVWTVALGFLRRVLPGGGSTTLSGDPLLLVGPAVIILLFLSAAAKGAFRSRSPLAKAVALFTLIALVAAANPLQGGFKVGLGGIMYVVVPLMCFWIGRTFLDDQTIRRLLWLVASLAVVNAVYGLFQTLVGLPSWDLKWVHTGGYEALNVGGVTRAFGSFASSEEYAAFLGIGFVCWVALLRRGGALRIPLCAAACAVIGTAIVLESGRGTVVWAVVALGVMAAARAGRKLGGAAIAVIAVLALLFLFAGQFSGSVPTSPGTDQGTSALTGHLISGLSDPLGAKSTAPGHFTEVAHGVSEAFTHPLGHGTGSVTVASGHLTGKSLGTEDDLGNAAVAFGLLGLVVYLVVLTRALSTAYRVARGRRDAVSLAVVGILVMVCLQWTNGGLYSVAWLVWLLLGWVDVTYEQATVTVTAPGLPAEPPLPGLVLQGGSGSGGPPAN